MAKELPYFKFEPGAWDSGNIQLCTFEEQGIFINICSLYWNRLGDLPYKLALQKVCGGNAVALTSLCEHDVLRVIEGMICIDFLNEQLGEFDTTSKKNSDNARSGWEKRKKNATALPKVSDRIARRGEERRESIYGEGEISIAVKPKYIKDVPLRIFDLRLYFDEEKQTSDLESKGWVHYEAFISANAGRVFNDTDHLYNAFRAFCADYKAPEKPPPKYGDAAYNKSIWSLEAWEKQYDWRLKSDNDFRKHFGYEELQSGTTVGIHSNGRSGAKGADRA